MWTVFDRLAGDQGVGDLGVAFPFPFDEEGIGLVWAPAGTADLDFGVAQCLALDVDAIGLSCAGNSGSAEGVSGSLVGVPVKAILPRLQPPGVVKEGMGIAPEEE